MASSAGGGPPAASRAVSDPILRNALRYTVSAREYATLHKYILSRSRVLKRNAPSVETVARIVNGDAGARPAVSSTPGDGSGGGATATGLEPASGGGRAGRGKGKKQQQQQQDAAATPPPVNDYNARAVRHSMRVFIATSIAMKTWSIVLKRIMGAKKDQAAAAAAAAASKKEPLYKSPTFRLSLSLSSILLLYRLLFRFFTRLRLHLLDPSAEPFRRRNPRTAGTLTSPYAPAVGASLAGLALGIYPAQQLRVSVAIYALFRALEFGWNAAEENGMVWGWDKGGRVRRERPWWWGSWMLQPLAFGQLLHACVLDRDCFPSQYGDMIFKWSGTYLQQRPPKYPRSLPWPGTYDIVDSLATMAKLNWPPFVSPTLFPDKTNTLPPQLSAIAPLSNRAHPLLTSLSCATLHPHDPSCARTYLTFWLRSFPAAARFFLAAYALMALPRFRLLYHAPASVLRRLLASALRTATFATGAVSTAWASICLLQAWLPRGALATQRFFLGGMAAGLWAWAERSRGRAVFLYSARQSVDSLWKVGVKRRWWRAMAAGDVWVFVLAVMLTGVVYERDAAAGIPDPTWRRGVSWVRGEGWRDWAMEADEEEDDEDEQGGEGEEEGEAERMEVGVDEGSGVLLRKEE
ncbi:hypothetical protein GGTG_02098 [Gaeumannomyces tritici R3-111a-1]|uniref:Transmembrane protein 135 N-terminal domain-containing protein n=1 Tax=Gaeumannomyces tritici (strain R3-111a-1) TaxID=644352 RepID=J3NLE9_GAET3|nr:hypothetical protein GGTG_02098 [Gaeumannomyces tritici R3-111a-1]EJT82124.1 hypothetical protein GGTG_02098 [Gaeumannomyces tritici R3-111a-1]